MEEKGTCEKHGEFVLTEGCLQCLAERRAAGITPAQDELEAGLNAEGSTLSKTAEELLPETALALAPGTDVEIMSYYDEAQRLQQYAESRVIATVKDIKVATDDLSIIAKLKRAMEEKRKLYILPLQDQVKQINETYKTLMAPVLEADKITKDKILAFNREQECIRAEQERINALRLEAAQKEAALSGTGEITEPVNLVEVTPEPAKSVSTDMGTTGMVDHWKWEVVDFALLPDEYKVVDGSLLTAVAKKHHDQKPIPGVKFYNEPIIAVRAR